MKNFLYILIIAFLAIVQSGNAQNIGDLDGIYYQAVAIDDSPKQIVGVDVEGKPLYNREIGVRFTITKGHDGDVQWEETHTPTTDKYGLFTVIIGKGDLSSSAYVRLLDMPWIDADQFLKVEISTKNDGDYKVVSNQKFMSVPYAFYCDDIADDAITTAKIFNEEILAEDINTGAVETSEILDETILAEDIAQGSVETSEILDETILAEDIGTGSVETSEILDETILAEDINTGAVTSSEILDATILNEDIADATIDLISKVTNVLPVANGGTGLAIIAADYILVGNGTSAMDTLAVTDSIMVFSNKSGQAELYKLVAGLRTNLTIDEVTKTIEISAIDQSGGPNKDLISFSTGNIPDGGQALRVIPYAGVKLGDIILVTATSDLQGVIMTAYVSTDDKINVVFFNSTGSPRNLGGDIKIANFGQ